MRVMIREFAKGGRKKYYRFIIDGWVLDHYIFEYRADYTTVVRIGLRRDIPKEQALIEAVEELVKSAHNYGWKEIPVSEFSQFLTHRDRRVRAAAKKCFTIS